MQKALKVNIIKSKERIKYNMIIAIGNSRKDKTFKIVDISWEQFLNKVSNTVRTVETIEEYEKMKKSIKDDIKDVGGCVGGKLKDGRRRKILHFLERRSAQNHRSFYLSEA